MVGTTISHYKVLEKIGQGGIGKVYRAEDTSLKRKRTIKLMPKFGNAILSITLILFLTAVGLAQGTWRSIGPEGGSIFALVVDPTDPMTLYAGTRGGVFRSLDGGDNWAPINTGLTNLDVQALAINPVTPSTLYAGTQSRLFEAGTESGVFRSLDGGNRWANIGLTNLDVQALAIDPITPFTLYTGTQSDGVYRSTDKGDNWAPINTGLTNLDVMVLAIDPITPATLYAGTQSGVFRSLDGGDNWASINTGLAVSSVQALAIDPLTPSTLYVVTFAGVFKSLDGGDSWNERGLAFRSVQALAIDPSVPTTLYAATCCSSSTIGVYRSLDGGNSWALFNTGLAAIIHKFGVSVDFLRKFRAESVFRCDYKASKLVEPNRDEARAPSGNSSARRGLYICVGAGSQGTVRWDTDGASVMRRAFVRDKTMPGAPRCDEKFSESGHRF